VRPASLVFLLAAFTGASASAEPRGYTASIPTAQLSISLGVSDGATTEYVGLNLGGIVGEASGEIVGILNPVLEVHTMVFQTMDSGQVVESLGSAAIPVTLTVESGTRIGYAEGTNWNYMVIDPQQLLEFDTGNVSEFLLVGEVELLGEHVPFSFSRLDVTGPQEGDVSSIRSEAGSLLPNAEAHSVALNEFLITAQYQPGAHYDLRVNERLLASDFAEVQGLHLTLTTALRFFTPDIWFVPEPRGRGVDNCGTWCHRIDWIRARAKEVGRSERRAIRMARAFALDGRRRAAPAA
jgi:hypothetical protein